MNDATSITWKYKNKSLWVRKQTDLRDIIECIIHSKWKWDGHIVRMEDNKWTTRLTKWAPRTHNRMRGQPKTRCRDDIDTFQTQMERPARDRRVWRQLRKAFVQQRNIEQSQGRMRGRRYIMI